MAVEFPFDFLFVRLMIALGTIGAGWIAYRVLNQIILLRARSRHPAGGVVYQDKPVLLYFTTPTCAPCKTLQRPAIRQLQQAVGNRLEVIEIDASAEPEVASQWGVLSVPTTFVIDPSGKPRHVNHGVASAEKLLRQIQNI